MEEAFIHLLLSDASVQAVLAQRINWTVGPQSGSAYPRATLQRASSQSDYHSQGSSKYRQVRVQMDIYGETFVSAQLAARAVKRRLSGYRGGIFQGIFLDSERDLPAADAGDVTRLFRVSSDYIIHYRET